MPCIHVTQTLITISRIQNVYFLLDMLGALNNKICFLYIPLEVKENEIMYDYRIYVKGKRNIFMIKAKLQTKISLMIVYNISLCK